MSFVWSGERRRWQWPQLLLFFFFFSKLSFYHKYFVSDQSQCCLTIVWNDTRVNTCVGMFCLCTMYMRLLLYPSETISTYQFMMRGIGYPTLSIVREVIHHFLYFCTQAQQHQFLKTQNILCSHFYFYAQWNPVNKISLRKNDLNSLLDTFLQCLFSSGKKQRSVWGHFA